MSASRKILSDATIAGDSGVTSTPVNGKLTIQIVGSATSGAGAASVPIYVSNDNVNWLLKTAISLTFGTTEVSAGYELDYPWAYVKLYVDSISGTGAKVSGYIGGLI